MKTMGVLVATVALALMLAAPANANLIVNGGFEDPAIPLGTFATFFAPVGTPAIPGWEALNGVEIQATVVGDPHSGRQLAELDADTNSAIRQQITTTPGQRYLLSYYYSPRPGQTAETNIIISSTTGTTPLLSRTITADGTGNVNTVWNRYANSFVADGSSVYVYFSAGGSSDSFGGYLDDVDVSAVPIPSAMLLFGSGLVGLIGIGRRRMKK